CGHKCLQRLAFPAGARRRRALRRKHAPRSTDSVEGVSLAARAALAAESADLEHPFATTGQKARETEAVRACPFDRERAPTPRVLLDEPQRLGVCEHRRCGDDGAADDVHDRERMRVALRIDTDDVVQLICEHPKTDLQPSVGGHDPVSVWGWKPRTAEL